VRGGRDDGYSSTPEGIPPIVMGVSEGMVVMEVEAVRRVGAVVVGRESVGIVGGGLVVVVIVGIVVGEESVGVVGVRMVGLVVVVGEESEGISVLMVGVGAARTVGVVGAVGVVGVGGELSLPAGMPVGAVVALAVGVSFRVVVVGVDSGVGIGVGGLVTSTSSSWISSGV
jgi:hypothetical protein